MVQIRLTCQEPDETESRDITEDEGGLASSSNLEKRSAHAALGREYLELPALAASPSRRNSGLAVPTQASLPGSRQRKFSFPAALPSGLPGSESPSGGISARRRFSNVSDAVARRLSHTIGWRSGQMQCREIVTVGKRLCSQYLRTRLKRAGYSNKKSGLRRLRSTVGSDGDSVFREVCPELLALGLELERQHPKLYVNVSRQASSAPGGKFSSEKEAGAVLTAVSRELLKHDLTWGKLISLYAVSGGLAVDCARQGHYDYLSSIVEAMEEVLEDEVAQWIQSKGGWVAIAGLVKPPNTNWLSKKVVIFVMSLFIIISLIVFTLALLGISSFFK